MLPDIMRRLWACGFGRCPGPPRRVPRPIGGAPLRIWLDWCRIERTATTRLTAVERKFLSTMPRPQVVERDPSSHGACDRNAASRTAAHEPNADETGGRMGRSNRVGRFGKVSAALSTDDGRQLLPLRTHLGLCGPLSGLSRVVTELSSSGGSTVTASTKTQASRRWESSVDILELWTEPDCDFATRRNLGHGGELTAPAAAHLHRMMADAFALRPAHLVVDLAACPRADGLALDVLLNAHRRALRLGISLVLRAPSEGLRRVLGLARLEHVFNINTDPSPWPPPRLRAAESPTPPSDQR